jgi:hypothetical protein
MCPHGILPVGSRRRFLLRQYRSNPGGAPKAPSRVSPRQERRIADSGLDAGLDLGAHKRCDLILEG